MKDQTPKPNTSKPNTLDILAKREPIHCADCGTKLGNRIDWEPFIHRGKHVAICAPCIDACMENPPCTLQYAYLYNTENERPIITELDTLEFYAQLNGDVIEPYEDELQEVPVPVSAGVK